MLVREGWDDLKNEIRSLAKDARGLRYVPNQGNAGDALIAAGAWQLFDVLQVSPRVTSAGEIRGGDTVLYGGGGNLVPEYDDCRKFLEHCLAVGVRRALVLPHTIRGHEELLKRLVGRFTLVCRDHDSRDYLLALGTGAKIIEAPDMALRLDFPALTARCASWPVRARTTRDLAVDGMLRTYLHWRAALRRLGAQGTATMRILRSDAESLGIPGDPSWDISRHYCSKFRTRGESDLVARDMIAFFRRARRVETNRLHVGIAAAFAGCRVSFTDNSYGKIGAVYRTSLAGIDTISYAPDGRGADERSLSGVSKRGFARV